MKIEFKRRPLKPIEKRLAALLLLVLAIAAVAALLIGPFWYGNVYYDQKLKAQDDTLRRYLKVAETQADLEDMTEQLAKLDGRKHFLSNTGQALAASEIQEVSKAIVEANGGKLISLQVGQVKEEGENRVLSVNFQLSCNMAALRKILYALETARPYLFVDNLVVRSQVNSQYKAVPGVEPEMSVQLDVFAYALGGVEAAK